MRATKGSVENTTVARDLPESSKKRRAAVVSVRSGLYPN